MKTTQKKPEEKRSGSERRQWYCHHDFPYVDTHGTLVIENRRENKGRRDSDKNLESNQNSDDNTNSNADGRKVKTV